ncbi:hypothetical protein [Streptomyces sp. NPDC093223]|uniref:hypothetical protein n=1 Tax=Streptomyces sp. NPDC093223 TaxID=3366033 RepID=UPI003809E9EF
MTSHTSTGNSSSMNSSVSLNDRDDSLALFCTGHHPRCLVEAEFAATVHLVRKIIR